MAEEYVPGSAAERQQIENDILKMKLMLETGAKIHSFRDPDVPPEIENYFLQNVMEFERQYKTDRKISVFEKIGRPDYLKPVTQLMDQQIDDEWEKLKALLCRHNIELSVCSPNVTVKELYRFVTEELFVLQMDDIHMPGLIYGFIYDEFHPDPVYDNTCQAVDYCMRHLLQKRPVEWLYNFCVEDLRLNEHYPLNAGELLEKVNRFKSAYDDISIRDIISTKCIMEEFDSFVHGKYCIDVTVGPERYSLAGNWIVHFKLDKQFDYWTITGVEIDDIKF